jgi:formylglycine-generating enzyme
MHRWVRVATIAVALVAIVGGVVGGMLWIFSNEDAARCPDGLVALGPRCCGEGQRFEGGRCIGKPTSCQEGFAIDDEGCRPKVFRRRLQIEGGTVTMGGSDWENAQPQRTASVATFTIDRDEVTCGDYAYCIREQGCDARPLDCEPAMPIVEVNTKEATQFCKFFGGRLPTPDEWVYTASGSEGRKYPWGSTGVVCRLAVFGLIDGPCARGGTGPDIVGSRPEGNSPRGVRDLAGNVAELTLTTQGDAEARGGSYASRAGYLLKTSASRPISPFDKLSDVGFRCVYPEKH